MLFPTLVLIANAFSYFLGLASAAPALPNGDSGIIQLPSSSSTNASIPHWLSKPNDPSFYHLSLGSPLYITLKDFGDQIAFRDAEYCLYVNPPIIALEPMHQHTTSFYCSFPVHLLFCLINFDASGDAWMDISLKIARSSEPHGGEVRQTIRWEHGSVRLKVFTNFPAVMSYELLQDYVSGIRTFAAKAGGYWACKIEFAARVREVEIRTLGRAEMSIVR